MKTLYCSLLLTGLALQPAFVQAQIVHSSNATIVAVNWHPTALIDSILVDVDADNIPDIRFLDRNIVPTGSGQPTTSTFTASISNSDVQMAIDSSEYDSAHRFLANDHIGRGLRWESGGYLAYSLIGNGGVGGRGFFRNGVTGYVVIRKRVAGSWRYWWFNIAGKAAATGSAVNYYGQSDAVLAIAGAQPATAVQAFPNPTTSSWLLTGKGHYQLVDGLGRTVNWGVVESAGIINGEQLPAGAYFLQFHMADGTVVKRTLLRQ